MKKDIAIKVDGISKTFKIPHEKINSVRGAFTAAFKSKSYEEFKALSDVSFEVKKGEFFGVIGRNGSGKSTLLKIIAGIYQQDSGEIKIDGMISPFLELGIGFNPELSGRDNIYLNATVLGMTKKQIDEKFDSIVNFSELERFIDQKLKNYSSGMQVRLAFSVSIHANRDILLMDEVLAVGDSNFQSKCLEEFNRYKDMGRTVIIVTHDINVIKRYCDRAILLRKGNIEMIGDPERVGDKYIYQNMSDEERRLIENKSLDSDANEEDRGSREIEIRAVKIFDEKKEQKKIFLSGAKLIFRIEYTVNNPENLNNIIFGLGVHLRENKQYCFALNSFIDKIKLSPDAIKRGFVEIEVPKLTLNEGHYYVNVIASNEKINFSKPIHFISRVSSFHVKDVEYNEGLFSVNHIWK